MRERIPSLDGLRGISIMMVLLGHLVGTVNFPRGLAFLPHVAHMGVLIFFVISGFLITTLLMKEQENAGKISLRNFYIRRVLRILPVSYVYISVIACLAYLGSIHLRPHDLAFAATYLMNYHNDPSWYLGHFWSLTTEEQFYLIWPALVVLLGFRKGFVAAATFLIIAPPGRFLVWRLFPHLSTNVGLAYGADFIAMGCLLAMCFEWLKGKRFFASLFFPVAMVCTMSAKIYLWSIHRPGYGLLVLINVLIALTIFRSVVVSDDFLGKILNSRVLSTVGVLSYSLYIWQQLFVNGESSASIFPLNVITAFAIATLSYYVVERPALKLKGRFTRTNASLAEKVSAPELAIGSLRRAG
jgi:peptidoglycan/LPS O-acetylase OafA/YrhL